MMHGSAWFAVPGASCFDVMLDNGLLHEIYQRKCNNTIPSRSDENTSFVSYCTNNVVSEEIFNSLPK